MKDDTIPGTDGGDPAGTRDLAAKIDYLFRTIYPAGRGPYSYKEAANGITTATGEAVSDTTLWKLRTGKSDNPTMRVIEGLATFFGVRPSYFFGDEEATRAVGEEIELLAILRNSGVRGAHLRTFAGLSPESREVVASLIENTAELERRHPKSGGRTDRTGTR